MKLCGRILVASLCCACTIGEPEPEPEQPATESPSDPTVASEPGPSVGLAADTLWAEASGELGDERFRLSLPIVLTREVLPRRDGTRWRYLQEEPDAQSLMVVVAHSRAPRPATIEDARARLELPELEELEAREDRQGTLFVHADPQRTTLVINYFTTLGERAVLCSVNFERDVPAPDFERLGERFERSCLGLRWIDPDPPTLGELGSSAAPIGRLCSRPYSISSTPGKGAQARDEDGAQAKQSAASKRLAKGLAVAIDARERQPWSSERGVEFDGLDPREAHTIEVFTASGERIRRLKLDFERRGSSDLCLGYNSFYGTWQLRALRVGARCGTCVTR